MILCLKNIPLFDVTEGEDDEVFAVVDQEVKSSAANGNNMDSRIGLDYIVENSDYVAKLAAALDTNNEIVKKQVFELLSALCAYSRSGYCRAIETLENYKVNKKSFHSQTPQTNSLLHFPSTSRISKTTDIASKWSSRSWTRQPQLNTKWRSWRSLTA